MKQIFFWKITSLFSILSLSLFFIFPKISAQTTQDMSDLKIFDITIDDRDILDIYNGNIGDLDIAQSTKGHTYIYIDNMDDPKWTYSWSTLANKTFLDAEGSAHLRPQVLTGTHKIKVCIDPNVIVNESDETNNCRTENFPQEDEPEDDDLKIDFYIKAVGIENQDSEEFYVDICSDNASTRDATLLIHGESGYKYFDNNFWGINIEEGECIRKYSFTFDTMNTDPGDVYTVTASADPYSMIDEEYENNNEKTVTLTIPGDSEDENSEDLANLRIVNFDIGDNYSMYADVCSLDTASSNVKVTFSGNNYSKSLILNNINADACVRANMDSSGFNFESELQYNILVTVDPEDTIDESNENDNRYSAEITFALENQRIDLYITDIGQEEDSFYVYLCSDNASTSNAELLIKGESAYKSFNNNFWGINLNAGQCKKIYGSIFDNINVDEGDTYTITATADPDDIIEEEAEYNNERVETLTVQ